MEPHIDEVCASLFSPNFHFEETNQENYVRLMFTKSTHEIYKLT